ncbi:phage integrase N-terminal domain-containing protein [Desulfofundulus thermosubterraneus]|uniref:phage integrase N-terminal domain-containing protein n=1 Tax=Desulfofundulus thermosubterraneus TaxID=348840 RepID=UPI00093565CF|nr:phage integrase N-terminal domain-containing protein [Desulfofundulus thermosubterraneus]
MLRVSWENTGNPILDRLGRQFVERVARYARGGSYEKRLERFRKYVKFLCFLAERFAPEDIRNIQPRHVAAFARHLKEQGRSGRTILYYFSIIRWWHRQIPWRKYEMPENKVLLELEARLDDKRFCEEIKNNCRRKKFRRGIQKSLGSA